MSFLDLARRLRAESSTPAPVTVPHPRPGPAPEPLAPPAPRPLPEPPAPGGPPVLLDPADLGAVPGSPHAELDRDWREALALARQRFAAHGGAPGGRDAPKFVRDAAVLECLIRTREREFAAWRDRWQECLEGVYTGAVALLPSFERDLLVAYRATGERVRCQRCGAAFPRPEGLASREPAQFCGRCTEGLQ